MGKGINNDILVSLFNTMLYIRRTEEKIADKYSEQKMRCPVHLCIGQEAICTGVIANLEKEDLVFSAHRSHGHYLARNGDLKKMIAEIHGKETGCSKGRGGSMHLIDLDVNFMGALPIVAGALPVAAGTAFASKFKKEKTITVCFIGDAATEEGTFHEVLNYASLNNIPLLVVCENNLYSTLTTIEERQPDRKISDLAKGHKIKAFHGDGNNVKEVFEKTKEAIEWIRSGNGPVFMEFVTYRWLEHCGPLDDHELGFRPKEDLEKWKKKDPIEKLEKELIENKILSESAIKKTEEEFKAKIEEAFKFAEESKFPDPKTIANYVYK